MCNIDFNFLVRCRKAHSRWNLPEYIGHIFDLEPFPKNFQRRLFELCLRATGHVLGINKQICTKNACKMQQTNKPKTFCKQHASIKRYFTTTLLNKCNSDHYASVWIITCCGPPVSALFICHETKNYMNIKHSFKLVFSKSTLTFNSHSFNIESCPTCSDMGLTCCCDTWLAGVTWTREQVIGRP